MLRGTVVDTADRPVASASVYFVSAPVPVRDVAVLTDDDGTFTLTAPTAGEYRIGANAEHFAPAETAVTVADVAEQTVRIRLSEI